MGKQVIILDMDGALSDHSQRVCHEHVKDWKKYHATMHLDKPHQAIVSIARLYALQGIKVFICTARSYDMQAATEVWLNENLVPYDLLIMRPPNNEEWSVDVKREMLKDIIKNGYEVLFAIEDKTSVVNMWREEGICCLQMEDLTAPKAQPRPHSTSEILEEAAKTFKERNAVYGNNFKMMGPLMVSLFPNGITLKTEEDFIWYHLFELMMVKVSRFVCGVEKGFLHIDSLHDAGVYSFMVQSAAEHINAKENIP